MKWWAIIFFSGLTILPLVFWPWGSVVYEVPRVWFVLRWIEGLVVAALWYGRTRGIRGRRGIRDKEKIFEPMDNWLMGLLVGFCAWALFTSLIGADPVKSILGNFYRRDGLVTLFHLVGFSFLVSMVWRGEWRCPLVRAISWGTLAVCMYTIVLGICYWFFGDRSVMVWDGGAIGGLFGNPNFLAGYLAVSVPFVFCWARAVIVDLRMPVWFRTVADRVGRPAPAKGLGRFGNLGILVVLFLTLLLTQSRGGILCFFLALAVYGCLLGSRLLQLMCGAGIVAALVVGLWLFQTDRQEDFVAEGRERIIRRILLGVGQRPLTGYGWANADYAFEAVVWPVAMRFDVYVDKAHGTVLEVLATTGMGGGGGRGGGGGGWGIC